MDISSKSIELLKQDTKRYINWIRTFKIEIDKNMFLAGSSTSPDYPIYPRNHDNFHYPLNMKNILKIGVTGIKDKALENSKKYTGNQKKYLLLIYDVYDELIKKIFEFAEVARNKGYSNISETCKKIASSSPKSFIEACQLYWFSIIFRIGTSSIGRIDQHLYPFYYNDIKKHIIDKEKAKDILAEIMFRFEKRGGGKGDTLQNITLSGRNKEGNDQTNDLTYMFLELSLEEKYIEPKINVRINKKSPDRLMELVSKLQLTGGGICTVYNDDVIIDGLIEYGRPVDVACDYCADGCTEIILDGHGETAFKYIDCVKAVEHTLFSGKENISEKKRLQYYSKLQDYEEVAIPCEKGIKTKSFLDMENFDEFYKAYLDQLKYQLNEILKIPYNCEEKPMRIFTAATMPSVIEDAVEPYKNKNCYHSYGIFIGSLGTAVNSIAAVKELVFEKKIISKEDLLDSIKSNFEKHKKIQQLCKNAKKFGNDCDYVDKIAVDIANNFSKWVDKFNKNSKDFVLPGLYNHLFHHTAYYVGATPDGRRFGDPVGEHLSPTPGSTYKGPTAIINSVCKIDLKKHIYAATLHLNMPITTFKGIEKPYTILKDVNKAFCLKKGLVMNTNILDVEKLIDAKKHPEKYPDLIVRVWGFSYYFTQLSEEMQDHVISRAMSEC